MLSEDLAALGHTVTVLAAVPHFPSGIVPGEYRHRWWQWDEANDVRICRVWVPSGDRANLRHRLLTFVIYQCLAALVGLGLRYDAVLVTNPAIETFLPFVVLGWLRRKPVLFAVWDLYPEIGVRLGVFRNPRVAAIVGWLEDFCLHRASLVQILAPAFEPALVARGVPPAKIVEVPPWIDTDFIRPLPRINPFSVEHGLDSRWVVLYAGNLGLSQGLENVLRAAFQLKARSDVRFVFVGDGPSKVQLVELAAELALDNVTFLPYQPRHRLPEVLATADVALVSLQRDVGDGSLPSKTFPILASQRPILAVVEADHDLARLVAETGAGVCVPPDDPMALAHALLALAEAPAERDEMGRCGRQYAERYFSRAAAAQRFETILSHTLR